MGKRRLSGRERVAAFVEHPITLLALAVLTGALALVYFRLLFVIAYVLFVLAIYRSGVFGTGVRSIGNLTASLLILAILGVLYAIVPSPLERPPTPTGFLQFDKFEIQGQFSEIAEGKQFGVSIYSRNPGPTRVLNAFGYSKAFVEPMDQSTDQRVQAAFEERVASLRKDQAAGRLKGPEQGIGMGLWTTVLTDPLTQEQAAGIVNGTRLVYFVSWLAWTDSEGHVQSAYDCRWLQPFSHVPYSREDVVWHYCQR